VVPTHCAALAADAADASTLAHAAFAVFAAAAITLAAAAIATAIAAAIAHAAFALASVLTPTSNLTRPRYDKIVCLR
jgi:hypothetical protein